jgi:hypothetical protein
MSGVTRCGVNKVTLRTAYILRASPSACLRWAVKCEGRVQTTRSASVSQRVLDSTGSVSRRVHQWARDPPTAPERQPGSRSPRTQTDECLGTAAEAFACRAAPGQTPAQRRWAAFPSAPTGAQLTPRQGLGQPVSVPPRFRESAARAQIRTYVQAPRRPGVVFGAAPLFVGDCPSGEAPRS